MNLWYNSARVVFMYSDELVCDMLNYIHDHLYETISMDELSRRFFYDKSYLMRKFKKALGMTIGYYDNAMRIYNSLSSYQTGDSVLKIALFHGFHSIEYYSEVFRSMMGVSPRTYKKFVQYRYYENEDEYYKMTTTVVQLQSLKKFVSDYQSRRKPVKLPVKKIRL